MFTFKVDTSAYKTLAVASKNTLAQQTQRAVRVALNAGSAYARTHHPHKRRTGLLTSASNLFGKVVSSNREGAWGYLENVTDYARYVEFGTEAHTIAPMDYSRPGGPRTTTGPRKGRVAKGYTAGAGRGHALRFRIGSAIVFAAEVEHPGAKPYPFMAPAADYAGQVLFDELNAVVIPAVRMLWK